MSAVTAQAPGLKATIAGESPANGLQSIRNRKG